MVFIGALGYVAYIAFHTGNPEYLAYPFDKAGNQCGFTPGYENYPYIYIGQFNFEPYFVCVSSCPTTNHTTLDCKLDPGLAITSCSDIGKNIPNYQSTQIVTYCLPTDQAIAIGQQLVTDILSVGVLQAYFSDLYVSWPLILSMIGVSLIVSLFYSVLIRYFAGCMVWTMILLLLTLLLVLGVGTLLISQDVQAFKDIINYDNLPEPLKDQTYLKVITGLCLSLFGIGFLIVCCMRR